MRALLYSDWETLEMVDLPKPELHEGEVLLKVGAAGICGSELEAVKKRSPRRKPPLVLGHEFTGVIEAVGAGVAAWKEGDAVVSNAVIADGTCPACRRGQPHLCANRQLFGMHRPGAFAEYVTAPASTLIPRTPGTSPAGAALSEPLANGIHIANLLKPDAPKNVVVFGAGPIGLLALQALKITFGCLVSVIDLNQARLDLALKLGADFVAEPEGLDALKVDDGFDASVDAVGAEETKAASVTAVHPGGVAVWIGLHENPSILNSYDLILPEKRVFGSYACTQAELAQALAWIEDGKVDVASWVSRYGLEEADKAFETMLHPGPGDVKGVIVNPN
jgi:L-iditol 2-dehydrogenase